MSSTTAGEGLACVSYPQVPGTKLTSPRSKEEWTFLDVSTRNYTHAIHLYPARMHPEIARRVITKYAKDTSKVIFDPFMGSGGVLLESTIHGNNAIGLDINPFAVLLSKVKTTPIKKNLHAELENILINSKRDFKNGRKYSDYMPSSYDLTKWFSSEVLRLLAILKHNIYKIKNQSILNFFKICLSLTMRKSSYQRNGSWKTHRMSADDIVGFNPKPLDLFGNIATDNIDKMRNLVKEKPSGTAYPTLGDSRNIQSSFKKLNHILHDGKVDLVITSPPYGDHHTTVAYGQFSRHSGHWLDLPDEQVKHVDRVGLGGRKYNDMHDLDSPTLNKTLDRIHKNDIKLTKKKTPDRDREAYAFFLDLDSCLDQISQNMTPKSYACFVVANRTVRRVVVPTNIILEELGKKHGFSVKSVIPRNIPNKAMPLKNAPENIINETGGTMTQESVIIMRC